MIEESSTTEDAGGKQSVLARVRAATVKHIRERPLTSVGLTIAAGFVIGGGLASGTTLRVLRRSMSLALQMAVIPALLARLRDTLLDEVES